MNLYNVSVKNEGQYCFVFAESKPSAISMFAKKNGSTDDLAGCRANLLAKNVGGKSCVINNYEHPGYLRVVTLGFRYEGGEVY